MFFFYGIFFLSTCYFILGCTTNRTKLFMFNSYALIKHRIDEPKRLAKLKQQEFEKSKELVDTITLVKLISENETFFITNEFKKLFLETNKNEYGNRLNMSMEDFLDTDIIHDIIHNVTDDDQEYKLSIEYTFIGTPYKTLLNKWITFPFYIPPPPGDKLRPKRKILSATIGNKNSPTENKDITSIMRTYAGPMHTFHSEFDGLFKPAMLLSDPLFDYTEEYDQVEDENKWVIPKDQTIKIIDSNAYTHVSSLYDDEFSW